MRLWPKRQEPEDRALPVVTTSPYAALSGSTTYGTVTPSSALQTADVFACVRVLVDAAASVPLIPYRRTAGGRERASEGQLASLLGRPAPATTQAALIGQIVAHLNLHGNCYIGKYRNADGQVVQLGLLHPEQVTPALKGGVPRYVISGGLTGLEQVEVGVEDVLHIRSALSVDGLTGLSPIQQCKTALRVADGAGRFVDNYLANGARPSGIITLPHGSNPQQAAEVREGFKSRQQGVDHMHGIAVFSGELGWTPIAPTLGDMEFVEQRQLATADICRIFRIPPWMVGASSGDSMTYSNTEQQQLAFVTHSLRPWLVLVEQAISGDADLCQPNVYVEFLLDALLRADSATRADVYAKALDPERGWMTRAEVRRAENLPAEPEPETGATTA